MPRAVLIRNPASRRAVDRTSLEAACASLDATWEVEVVESTRALGVSAIARDAAIAGVDCVMACGGDGTLNEVLNGVISAGRPEVVVGLIPSGTANVWAREARITRDPTAAVRLLADGRSVALDAGRLRMGTIDRRFLLMCSMGVDAAVVAEVERRPGLKRRLAQAAYVLGGLPVLRRFSPVRLSLDGISMSQPVALVVAGNSRLYGGVIRLTGKARMDDGLLDLAILYQQAGWRGWFDVAGQVVSRPAGIYRGNDRRAPSFSLVPDSRIAVQCDGEFIGWAEAGVEIQIDTEHAAVRMLVPPGESDLFDIEATPPAI